MKRPFDNIAATSDVSCSCNVFRAVHWSMSWGTEQWKSAFTTKTLKQSSFQNSVEEVTHTSFQTPVKYSHECTCLHYSSDPSHSLAPTPNAWGTWTLESSKAVSVPRGVGEWIRIWCSLETISSHYLLLPSPGEVQALTLHPCPYHVLSFISWLMNLEKRILHMHSSALTF